MYLFDQKKRLLNREIRGILIDHHEKTTTKSTVAVIILREKSIQGKKQKRKANIFIKIKTMKIKYLLKNMYKCGAVLIEWKRVS